MIDAVSLYIHTIIFYDRNRTINVRVFTRLSNMRIKASPIVVGHNNTEIFAFSDPPSRKNMFFRALSYVGKCLLLNSFFSGCYGPVVFRWENRKILIFPRIVAFVSVLGASACSMWKSVFWKFLWE